MLALTSCSRAINDTETPGWYEASTTLRLKAGGKFGRRPGQRGGAVSKVVSTKNGVHYLGELGGLSGEGVGRTVTLFSFNGQTGLGRTRRYWSLPTVAWPFSPFACLSEAAVGDAARASRTQLTPEAEVAAQRLGKRVARRGLPASTNEYIIAHIETTQVQKTSIVSRR